MWPERRLISVDLPAPFGPMTAWISPRANAIETSLTAARPPKKRLSLSATRMGSGIGFSRRSVKGQAQAHARDSTRQKQDRKNDEQPHGEKPMLRHAGELGLDQNQDERAQDGAVERSHAAEDDHHQNLARQLPAEKFGIHEAELSGAEITGETRDRACDDETRELVTERRKPQGAQSILVRLDALDRSSEERSEDHPQKKEH